MEFSFNNKKDIAKYQLCTCLANTLTNTTIYLNDSALIMRSGEVSFICIVLYYYLLVLWSSDFDMYLLVVILDTTFSLFNSLAAY